MADVPIRTSRPITALLLGLLATVAVGVMHLGRLDQRAELAALDLRFRCCSSLPPPAGVLCVDIDDSSLAEMGAWPWPRENLAGVLGALQEAGAGRVALDTLVSQPQEPRFVPAADLYSGGDVPLISNAPPRPVFDDVLLARTLRQYPTVYLPMAVEPADPPTPLGVVLERAMAGRPTLTLAVAAAEVHLPADAVAGEFRRAKVRAIDARVGEILASRPALDFQAVRGILLGDQPAGRRTLELELVQDAYLRHRSLAAMRKFAVPPAAVQGYPALDGRIVPPLVTLAQAAGRGGFVRCPPDLDGVVRRVPLLAKGPGGAFAQLAFAMALDELSRPGAGSRPGPAGGPGGSAASFTAAPGAVTVQLPDGTRRVIPVDEDGAMLIHWAVPPSGREGVRHVSAAWVARTWRLRQRLEQNRNLQRLLCAVLADRLRLAKLGGTSQEADKLYWDLLEHSAQCTKLASQRLDGDVAREWAMLYDPAHVPAESGYLAAAAAEADKTLDALCGRLRTLLGTVHLVAPAPRETATASEAARARLEYEQAKALVNEVTYLRGMADRLAADAPTIQADADAALADLRRTVAGAICLVGPGAAAAPHDAAATPLSAQTPDTVIQAHILNTILQGAFIRPALPATGVLMILLAGTAVSFLTAVRPAWQAGVLSLVLGAAYAVFNGLVLFTQWRLWLIVAAPLAAMAAGFVVVAVYRRLTEDRAKNEIRRTFGFAMSPAGVEQLIQDPALADLDGRRCEVSCLRAGLADFAALPRRLGEAATVRLLNRCFDRMTEAIQARCGGFVSTFLGEGLFAFFGAPIPQEDHARRAVAAALECQKELARLNQVLRQDLDDPPRLSCRIGLATGAAIVGNLGSSRRLDYSAAGEAVGLAAALERTNRFFATAILVEQETWRRGGMETVPARPLGLLRLPGRPEPVAAWNLWTGPGADERAVRAAFDEFSRAADLFARRRFIVAGEIFETVLKTLAEDGPSRIYRDLCRHYVQNPPGEDWDAAVLVEETGSAQ